MATSSGLHSFVPPGACHPRIAFSVEGALLTGGAVYAAVLSLVCTALGYKIYQKHNLENDVREQIRRFGTLLVVSVFCLCLGVFLAGRCVECGIGCASCASECSSVSCVVANELPEGYVVLALLMLVSCVIILESVNGLTIYRVEATDLLGGLISARFTDGWNGIGGPLGEWLLRIGFVMTVITGLIPAKTSNCGLQPPEVTALTGDDCFDVLMTNLHTIGINLGLVLAILGGLIRLFTPRKVGGEWKRFTCGISICYITSLIVLSLVFLLVMGLVLLVIYLQYTGDTALDVDFCPHYKTKAACLGKELPAQWYSWAVARKQADFDFLTTDGWQCEWLDNVSSISLPCVRINCDHGGRLHNRKVAIITEFLGMVWAIYGINFTIWAISIVDRMTHMSKDKFDYDGAAGLAEKNEGLAEQQHE